MIERKVFKDPFIIREYYCNDIVNMINSEDKILYVGYSEDDILLTKLIEKKFNLSVLDKNRILDIRIIEEKRICCDIYSYLNKGQLNFNVIIICFVLHENKIKDQLYILNQLKKLHNKKIIIIEPLKLKDDFSIKLQKKFIKRRKNYNSIKFWINIFSKNAEIKLLVSKPIKFKSKKILMPDLIYIKYG
ncbi:MAG: hypothetical protein Q4B52_06370 [Tissierellia bacterium]|nr:hypothetical protein [Tissierellia bacterium]